MPPHFVAIKGLPPAVSPPTVGNTTFEEAHDLLGDDTVLFHGNLSPSIFPKTSLTRAELWCELDRL